MLSLSKRLASARLDGALVTVEPNEEPKSCKRLTKSKKK